MISTKISAGRKTPVTYQTRAVSRDGLNGNTAEGRKSVSLCSPTCMAALVGDDAEASSPMKNVEQIAGNSLPIFSNRLFVDVALQ